MAKLDNEILNAALIGYQKELERIQGKIAELHKQLGKRPAASSQADSRRARKHHVSAAGRARIAAAQRKRWAAAKRAAAPKKRKLTAEQRAALVERLKKAR